MVDIPRTEDMVPHVNTDVCTRCRKPILPGHRIFQVRISGGSGRDPNDPGRIGLFIADEWEFAHVDCYDPLLKNRLGIL
jgi:hypothetical protein